MSHIVRLPGIWNCIVDSIEGPQGASALLSIIACAILLKCEGTVKGNMKRHSKAPLF